MVQNALAQTEIFGSYLQKLVIGKELKALLKAQLFGRNQAQSFVRTGSAGVGQVLGAADIYIDVIVLRADANDHAGIYLGAGIDEQSAALLCIPQAVCNSLAGLKGNERAGVAACNLTLVGLVTLKDGSQNTLALGVGQKLVAVAEEAAGGNQELHLHAVAYGGSSQ